MGYNRKDDLLPGAVLCLLGYGLYLLWQWDSGLF